MPSVSFNVNDKVFVGQSYGWSDVKFTPGVIVRISPTGRITVLRHGSADYETVFGKDCRELGDRYRGHWIDTEMTYAERQRYIAMRGRIDAAAAVLLEIKADTSNHYREKESVVCEFNRLEKLFNQARKLVEAI